MFYVLEGSVTVEVAGERNVLEAGDSLHFQSTKIHSSWNHRDTPATILWVGTMDVFGEKGTGPGGRRRPNGGTAYRPPVPTTRNAKKCIEQPEVDQ